ncbi:MAG: BlaI/MecI/CopY family transcriptional regulator [Flavobacteriales bacterium]|nr:BlaI/MecI/CopY family transcriptional regulator [Flavobacteriales bacterium]
MKNLTEKELQLMNHLWQIKKGYLKDIVNQFEEPKPAYTTISTLINRLISKKHLGFKMHGRDKEYFPILKKPTYFKFEFKKMLNNYFDDSTSQFASFFTENNDMTVEQLKELQNMVHHQIEKKTNNK